MRCLVVHAHPDPESFSAALRQAAVSGLESAGHHVDVIDLYASNYQAALPAAELADYMGVAKDHPDPLVANHLQLLSSADALIVIYPTWWNAMPAILKGWLDRTLLPDVAFTLDPRTHKLKPGLGNIRHLVGITTTGSPSWAVRFAGNPGRRTICRTVRLLCHKRCRRTWLSQPKMDTATQRDRETFITNVTDSMASL